MTSKGRAPKRANGTGSIRKLKNGYRVRYRDESGRQIVEPTLFRTKGDASRWLNRRADQVAFGTWQDPNRGRVPFGTYAESVIAGKRYTIRSRVLAELNWRNHIEPTFGPTLLSDITPEMVQRWYLDLEQRTGKGALRNSHNLLKAVLTCAVKEKLIAENPVKIDGGNKAVGSPRPLMQYADAVAIAEEILPHLRALVLVAWWTSARLGELLALRWEDLSFETGRLRIHRQVVWHGRELVEAPPKLHSHRTIAVSDLGLDVLRAVYDAAGRPPPSERIFKGCADQPLAHHSVSQAWKYARLKAGLPQFRFHDLRHGSATEYSRNGATLRDVMKRLGHKTVNAAMVYQHASDERDAEIVARMAARARGPQLA